MPYEGSVDIDGEGFDSEDEGFEPTTSENDPDIDNSSTSDEVEKIEEVVQEPEGDEPKAPATTDKGTKLADDPIQQANQLRANAERNAKQYEELLMDPEQLERYLQDLKKEKGYKGAEETTDVSPQTKEILNVDPDKIETVEDLRNFAKALQQTISGEVETVKKTIGGMVAGQQANATITKVHNGIESAKAKYPELREKNADGTPNPLFNKVFDEKLGSLYEKLDFDPKTRMFRGQVDIVELADTLADMMNVGKSKGSVDAQTIVKDKRSGKIPQGGTGTSSEVDDKDLSPSQIIAKRIQRSRSAGRRR